MSVQCDIGDGGNTQPHTWSQCHAVTAAGGLQGAVFVCTDRQTDTYTLTHTHTLTITADDG